MGSERGKGRVRPRWPISVLGFGLVLAACSTTTEQPAPPPPPPPPPAERALVAWADATCAHLKRLDGLRAEFGKLEKDLADTSSPVLDGAQADSYVSSAVGAVDSVTTELKGLTPSGIQAADAHVAAVVAVLDGIRPQLPAPDDPALRQAPDGEKIARAELVGGIVAAIEPQEPKLKALAEGTPQLISSYNLAPECTPAGQPDERGRELVLWSTGLCESMSALLTLDTDPLDNPALNDPRFAQFAAFELAHYITASAAPVTRIAEQLGSVPQTGIKEADEYRAGLLTAIQSALSKLPKNELGGLPPDSQPVDQLKAQAVQVADILKSIKPTEQPDMAAVAAASPELSTAYNLAPACAPRSTPSTELPPAANGTDLSACQSGACQIQVSGTTDLSMGGFTFTITVTSSSVTINHDTGVLRVGAQGQGSFGNPDRTIRFKVLGLREGTAVLDITTS